MNQLAMDTTARLAAEINIIKEQTARQVLSASIEIGLRLEQAKSLVEHGQWETWLQENVSYSQSTAQNLMRIAREYGSNQLDLTGRSAADVFEQLTYSQAVALFALPEPERVEFVQTHDVTEMSTRDLQAAIAEEKAARAEAERISEESRNEAERLRSDVSRLEDELSHERDRVDREVGSALKASEKADATARKEKERADKLEAQRAALEAQLNELKETPPEITDEQRAEIERQIEQKYSDRIAQLTIDADTAESQRAAIAEEKAALERRIQQESDKELLKFQTLFERLQQDVTVLVELTESIGGERGAKLHDILWQTLVTIIDGDS